MSLTIRKRVDGTVTLENESPPEEHTFAARFIQREVASDVVEVLVKLKLDTGEVVYRMVDFEKDENGNPNLTGWECELVKEG
jgi:hypothetical protein